VLGFMLGPLMEENFRRAMYLSRGDRRVFLERPISAALLALALALPVVWFFPPYGRSARRCFASDADVHGSRQPCLWKIATPPES
jgi:putative tricarboxylic transport membrane protein